MWQRVSKQLRRSKHRRLIGCWHHLVVKLCQRQRTRHIHPREWTGRVNRPVCVGFLPPLLSDIKSVTPWVYVQLEPRVSVPNHVATFSPWFPHISLGPCMLSFDFSKVRKMGENCLAIFPKKDNNHQDGILFQKSRSEVMIFSHQEKKGATAKLTVPFNLHIIHRQIFSAQRTAQMFMFDLASVMVWRNRWSFHTKINVETWNVWVEWQHGRIL